MNDHDETEDLQAPPELVAALRNVQKERVFIPPQVDESILQHAREHLRPQRRKILSLPAWAAMAASFVLAAGLFAYLMRTEPRHFAAEDINQDGQLDILDAFALAQRIEAGNNAGIDFNRDGEVDQEDAASLAKEAVSLSRSNAFETSFFDTNCTNSHELGDQFPGFVEAPYLVHASGIFCQKDSVGGGSDLPALKSLENLRKPTTKLPLLAQTRRGHGERSSNFDICNAGRTETSVLTPLPNPLLVWARRGDLLLDFLECSVFFVSLTKWQWGEGRDEGEIHLKISKIEVIRLALTKPFGLNQGDRS